MSVRFSWEPQEFSGSLCSAFEWLAAQSYDAVVQDDLAVCMISASDGGEATLAFRIMVYGSKYSKVAAEAQTKGYEEVIGTQVLNVPSYMLENEVYLPVLEAALVNTIVAARKKMLVNRITLLESLKPLYPLLKARIAELQDQYEELENHYS